jgi:hypothetical protein
MLSKSWKPLIHSLPEGTCFSGQLKTLVVVMNRLGVFFICYHWLCCSGPSSCIFWPNSKPGTPSTSQILVVYSFLVTLCYFPGQLSDCPSPQCVS